MTGIRTGAVLAMAMLSCKAKGDMEQQCHDAIEHWRTVSTMPMREGDEKMFMGACMMWKSETVDCIKASKHDDDIKKCRDMENSQGPGSPDRAAPRSGAQVQ